MAKNLYFCIRKPKSNYWWTHPHITALSATCGVTYRDFRFQPPTVNGWPRGWRKTQKNKRKQRNQKKLKTNPSSRILTTASSLRSACYPESSVPYLPISTSTKNLNWCGRNVHDEAFPWYQYPSRLSLQARAFLQGHRNPLRDVWTQNTPRHYLISYHH